MDSANKDFSTVLSVSDEELLQRWSENFSRFGSAPEDIRVEVVRRSVHRLLDSSRRLERLTIGLIVLTIALFLVAIPPAVEALSRSLKPRLANPGQGPK